MFNVCNFATKITKMNLENRINAFVKLGLFLKQFKSNKQNEGLKELNDKFFSDFDELIYRQQAFNGWFDRANVLNAIDAIADSLTESELREWLGNYNIEDDSNKTVGVILAGNIPIVGFHDYLCVLISGNRIKAKLSSSDKTLLPKVSEILIYLENDFEPKIEFVDKLENFDAVIATGSNNTARYFTQYFGKYPHIIRKNRNSVAIIDEKDGVSDLDGLGKDIFSYYGLGCRNVSKLYVPAGYRLDTIFEALFDFKYVVDNNKYANNYDYNKAVYLLGSNELLDNNFLLFKPDESLTSPVGVLHYEFYQDVESLKQHLEEIRESIQCVVSSKNSSIETLNFGEAQCPKLSDYADGVDTLKFILTF